MTKSRPALSVKRKQAALRATSSAAAGKTKGNGVDLGVNDLRYWKKLALRETKSKCKDCAIDNVVHEERRQALIYVQENLDKATRERNFALTQRNEAIAKLTAALAEAETAKELSEGRLKELLRVADKNRDLDRANMNLEVETASLDASRLLQANTLKALREELKLAKKDATDWALNHAKEKRDADRWCRNANMAATIAFGFFVLAGSLGWLAYHNKHAAIYTERPPSRSYCTQDMHTYWPARTDGTCYLEDRP